MQGNVGGGVSGILQSLGLGPETAEQVGSAIDGVVSAVPGGSEPHSDRHSNLQNGLYFGGGTAVSNFLISLGLDSGVAASVGGAVDNVINAVQGQQAGYRRPFKPSRMVCILVVVQPFPTSSSAWGWIAVRRPR